MTLATFQHAFWHSVWAPPEAPSAQPWASQPGFAIYRNTVLKGCADALLANYPAVRRLVGDDWLRAAAVAHVREHPPEAHSLHGYGEHFAHFITAAATQADMPWLVDVARLDRCWTEAHTAADAPTLVPEALATITADTLPHTRLSVHPAARWRWCAEWPAYSLWQAAREGWDDPNPPHWQGQGALLTRPHGAVWWCEIDAATAALLGACARGDTLPDAIAAAHQHNPAMDLGAMLGQLITQGAFTAITP